MNLEGKTYKIMGPLPYGSEVWVEDRKLETVDEKIDFLLALSDEPAARIVNAFHFFFEQDERIEIYAEAAAFERNLFDIIWPIVCKRYPVLCEGVIDKELGQKIMGMNIRAILRI